MALEFIGSYEKLKGKSGSELVHLIVHSSTLDLPRGGWAKVVHMNAHVDDFVLLLQPIRRYYAA